MPESLLLSAILQQAGELASKDMYQAARACYQELRDAVAQPTELQAGAWNARA